MIVVFCVCTKVLCMIDFRRDGWQLFSSMQVWEQLVNQTKKASKDHAALADIYGTHISQRCNNITEDLQRMYKKVSEIVRFTRH